MSEQKEKSLGQLFGEELAKAMIFAVSSTADNSKSLGYDAAVDHVAKRFIKTEKEVLIFKAIMAGEKEGILKDV